MRRKVYFLAMVLGMGILISSPASASGNITVSSIPSGSSVFIDGISTGTITPTTIEGVASGTHYILLRLTGYQDFTQSVSVSNNATSTISIALVAATTTTPEIVNGSIEVESDPSNAAVFLNTEYRGKTPLTINNVTHGTYRVLIQKTGYQDWSDRISVTSGVRTDVYASLEVEETDTTIITTSPTITTVKTTIAKTSTAKVPTPWPSGTPNPASSIDVLVIIGAVGFGLVVFRK